MSDSGDSEPSGNRGDGGPGSPDQQTSQAAGLASVERVFLRLTFWQTLLSLAGVFTGAVALYAALTESQAVREQTAASVWPYVQMMINDTDDGTKAHFALSLENVGVGPARMRGMRLMLAGEPVLTWDDASRRLVGEVARVGVDYGRSSVSHRVIAPGESVAAFQTHERRLAVAMQQAVHSGQVELSYCFCSIFDHCWSGGVSPGSGHADPEAVPACPDYGAGAFRD